jgi:DNA modification methylase
MTAPELFLDGRVALHAGDCLDVLRGMADASVDSVVTDPPYHLTPIVKRFGAANAAGAKDYSGKKPNATGAYARASKGFMGQEWDGGDIAFRVELWAEVWRVLKPGGHLAAFSATRTYHRMACAIEDAGFEIRDQLAWMYGTGFPKSLDVSKAIDKAAGAARETVAVGAPVKRLIPGADQARGGWEKNDGRVYTPAVTAPATEDAARWQGWGTALKPAFEPICLARKPLAEATVAANVRAHGTGAINIDACRIGDDVREAAFTSLAACSGNALGAAGTQAARRGTQGDPKIYVGRWPANVVHDGSDEVVAAFPDSAGQQAATTGAEPSTPSKNVYGARGRVASLPVRGDSGSAARFFFSAKAGRLDRLKSKHPTVKPVELMRWLVRLLTPPGGVVLDPFAGTGTTGAAAYLDGFSAVLVERGAEYRADIAARMRMVLAGPDELARALAEPAPHEDLPLFGGEAAAAPAGGGGRRVYGRFASDGSGRRD